MKNDCGCQNHGAKTKMILAKRFTVFFCFGMPKVLGNASATHVSDAPKVRNIRFRMPQEVALALKKEFFKNLNISIFP